MRVTQEGMVQNALLRLQHRVSSLDEAGRRLSSGKALQIASDDVSGMNRVLSLRSRMRAREQEARNGADGMTWLNVTDSKLQTVTTRLGRARELMVRGGSSTDASARDAMAAEIESIRAELVSLSNTRIDGRPLFSGTSDATPVTGPPWAYGGNTGAIERRVSEEDKVAVNVNGNELFGFAAGADLFSMLDQVAADLRAGNSTAVSSALADMDVALERVMKELSTIGAATNRIEAAMVRNSDEQLALRGELAQVEDVDLSAAIMDLQTQEVAYQATLGALSRVLQPSLVDFLR
jgi:flagellar hook-associated protein 3 FlgL